MLLTNIPRPYLPFLNRVIDYWVHVKNVRKFLYSPRADDRRIARRSTTIPRRNAVRIRVASTNDISFNNEPTCFSWQYLHALIDVHVDCVSHVMTHFFLCVCNIFLSIGLGFFYCVWF